MIVEADDAIEMGNHNYSKDFRVLLNDLSIEDTS